MQSLKKRYKWILYILSIPILYGLISFICISITLNDQMTSKSLSQTIYLKTNGVHLDIIIPTVNIQPSLRSGLRYYENENYIAFGWGDENFYLNTPTWGDLTFSNAFGAMFLKSSTLMHVTRYTDVQNNWVQIKLNDTQFKTLNTYILNTFKANEHGNKIILKDKGYTASDDFYKANGSYSCITTCNTWVNSGFKESELKSCFWTPFDFGLLSKYR